MNMLRWFKANKLDNDNDRNKNSLIAAKTCKITEMPKNHITKPESQYK